MKYDINPDNYWYGIQVYPDTAIGKFLMKEPELCTHMHHHTPKHDHVLCENCQSIFTDDGWGIASHMWFKDYNHAVFYKEHGRMPTLYGEG